MGFFLRKKDNKFFQGNVLRDEAGKFHFWKYTTFFQCSESFLLKYKKLFKKVPFPEMQEKRLFEKIYELFPGHFFTKNTRFVLVKKFAG